MENENKIQEKIDKRVFIRMVAEKARFTIKDTYILWDAIEQVFSYCIENKIPIWITGFGSLTITEAKSHREDGKFVKWDGIRKEYFEMSRPPLQILFRLSNALKKAKQSGEQEFDESDETE